MPGLVCADLTVEIRCTFRASIAGDGVTFIAVGTPASGGKIYLKYMEAPSSEIGVALRHDANHHSEEDGDTCTTVGIVGTALESASGRIAG
jgi:hypothetical protein